jgi:hypothetical protein
MQRLTGARLPAKRQSRGWAPRTAAAPIRMQVLPNEFIVLGSSKLVNRFMSRGSAAVWAQRVSAKRRRCDAGRGILTRNTDEEY